MSAPAELAQLKAENNELKILQQTSFETTNVQNPDSLQDILNLAKVIAASGIFADIKTAQKAAGMMILGKQYGLTCAQSLSGALHVVQGKPMLHYTTILARVRQHPDYDYKIITRTEEEAAIEFFRHGESCGVSEFTIKEARERKTQNVATMAKVMLMARAVGDGVRLYCPDVLNGTTLYVQGEMDDDERPVSESSAKAQAIRDRIAQKRTGHHEAIDAEIVEPKTEEPGVPLWLSVIGFDFMAFKDFSDYLASRNLSIDRVKAEAESKAIETVNALYEMTDAMEPGLGL